MAEGAGDCHRPAHRRLVRAPVRVPLLPALQRSFFHRPDTRGRQLVADARLAASPYHQWDGGASDRTLAVFAAPPPAVPSTASGVRTRLRYRNPVRLLGCIPARRWDDLWEGLGFWLAWHVHGLPPR